MICEEVKACRICGNSRLVPVCDLGEMALTGFFPASSYQKVPRGPLELVKCSGGSAEAFCGLVQLRHTYDQRFLFGAHYGYRSGLSLPMRQHLNELAQKVLFSGILRPGDRILDIGSNDGTLLSFYPPGEFQLVGIDPTAEKFQRYYPEGLRTVNDFFSADALKRELGDARFKVITAIAVFYDVPAPLQFLRQVKELLAEDGVLILEQGYLPCMLKTNAYDAICHEHLGYYALRQILWLAREAGLMVADCELTEVNGGSFCVTLTLPGRRPSGRLEKFLSREESSGLEEPGTYESFKSRIIKNRGQVREMVAQLHAQGLTVCGYGASTKGNVQLQYCGFGPQDIPWIADINEEKWGCFCPGSGIPILPEDEALRKNPDVLFVLPWHLREHILQKEKDFRGRKGRFLFSLPEMILV